ncbi:MAG TPA: hypothetical protein VGR63_02475 [Casimicrobiaceae bacterium]|jgi:Zn finger protein HypA/HybF involved in hydrogenase expression|nr:hypothetical protein [Casimicrobiaceae bacterium]
MYSAKRPAPGNTGTGRFVLHFPEMPKVFRCADCGHPDSRDETHAQGCPHVPALSKEELIALARIVEAQAAEKEAAVRDWRRAS